MTRKLFLFIGRLLAPLLGASSVEALRFVSVVFRLQASLVAEKSQGSVLRSVDANFAALTARATKRRGPPPRALLLFRANSGISLHSRDFASSSISRRHSERR